tara:strand:+ start:2766 stop:3896 length:1131 start_codon:yes stop_codon:yes gene_type:complete
LNSFFSNIKLEGDRIIWGVLFALSLFSLLIVFSTAGWSYLFKHAIKLFIGLVLTYIIHKIKFKYFSKLGQLAYFMSIFLLSLVFIIGVTINGASRWLSIAGLQFQPSDIAKLAIILFLARQLSRKRNILNSLKNIIWYLVAPLILISLLILPNNFSTSALVFLNGLALMFVAKIRLKYILTIILSAFIFFLSIYSITKYTDIGSKIIPRSVTWVSRIDGFLFEKENDDQTKDYQQVQSLVAIQNGGIKGVGPGKSIQRSILPYSSSDFIFSIIIEEYGLIGGVGVILAYLILFFRATLISFKVESLFGNLVTVGLIFSLIFQALINMLVTVEILPITGQTLPLISMGGTSIVFTCISIGMVLSISRDSTDRDYEKA